MQIQRQDVNDADLLDFSSKRQLKVAKVANKTLPKECQCTTIALMMTIREMCFLMT